MRYALCILAIALLAPLASGSAPSAPAAANSAQTIEQAVEARSRAWVKASLDCDADTFRTFATADYVMLWVDPAANGKPARWHVRSRDEWVDAIRTGKTKYLSVKLFNTKVRLNGDVATFAGEYTQTGREDGKDATESGFFVETWAKRGDQWFAVSSVFL